MIVKCDVCQKSLDDEYRSTVCPHVAFPANDGKNNFETHRKSFISDGAGTCPDCGSQNTQADPLYCNDCGFGP